MSPNSIALSYEDDNGNEYTSTPVLHVNGVTLTNTQSITPNMTLLTFLREHCRLTGAKLGCGEGGCGACTVLLSSMDESTGQIRHRSVNACLFPALAAHNCHVTTVEGIGDTKDPHPIQSLMVQLHGSQCGFCTPGIVMSLFASSVNQEKMHIDGNLCRCTGYRPIWDVMRCLSDTNGDDFAHCTPDQCAKCDTKHCRDGKEEEKTSQYCCGDQAHTCSSTVSSSSSDKAAAYKMSGVSSINEKTTVLLRKIHLLLSRKRDKTEKGVSIVKHLSFRSKPVGPCGSLEWIQPHTLSEMLMLLTDSSTVLISGNTEVGIDVKFKNSGGIPHFRRYVYPNCVQELHTILDTSTALTIGANVDLSTLSSHCKIRADESPIYSTISNMLEYFASQQIRNVATLAGNVATASPISDMCPVLLSLDANIQIVSLDNECGDPLPSLVTRSFALGDFFLSYRKTQLNPGEVIKCIKIPKCIDSETANVQEFCMPFKQARRREDDISIVSSGMYMALDNTTLIVKKARFAFGGMAPTPILAKETARMIIGEKFSLTSTFGLAKKALLAEFNLPENVPGGQSQYRRALACSFLFKFFNYINHKISSEIGSENIFDSYMSRPRVVPNGRQEYPTPMLVPGLEAAQQQNAYHTNKTKDTIGVPATHASATQHCTGEAIYVDDMPNPPGLLHGALVLSHRANGKVKEIEKSPALAIDGVEHVITYEDYRAALPKGINKWGAVVKDEEIISSGEIKCFGTVVGIVLGKTLEAAQAGAAAVKVLYEDNEYPLIMEIKEAIAHKSFYESTRHTIESGSVNECFDANKDGYIEVEGDFFAGGQEHFYLECNSSLCIPTEGNTGLEVFCSTQAVNKTQMHCASAAALPANKVRVSMKRMGGGFGGKETRTVPHTALCAVACRISNTAVKLTLDRNVDMSITGQRHAFYARYKASSFVVDKRRVLGGMRCDIYSNAGCSLDLSGPVMDRALFHIDGPYKWSAMKVEGVCCKTHQPPHTAFRGFGGPQGMAICEHIIDHICSKAGLKGEEIDNFRFHNLYKESDHTHFGQMIEFGTWNVPRAMSNILTCHGDTISERRVQIDQFNANNKYRKRGIAIIPTKFGIAFTAKFMNQGGALVHLYTDGTVLISHGGTEMGQGLHTKVAQVAACAFDISLDNVHVCETASDKVANAQPTAASMSTDMYGMATLNACNEILANIKPVREKLGPHATLAEVATAAYFERIDLSAHGFFKLMDERCGYDWEAEIPADYIGPDNKFRGHPFNYFTQGVAASEVEIDVLTGDYMIIRSDLMVDVGSSINPAIDIGQIEGAFIQGVGWSTTEEMIWGDNEHTWVRQGRLHSQGPGTYKIPAFDDIPQCFNVTLMDGISNPFAVHSSKAVGEPPFFLGCSVFFAIKEAIRAARIQGNVDGTILDNINTAEFSLMLPATSERIRMAVNDEICKDSLSNGTSDELFNSFQPKGSF